MILIKIRIIIIPFIETGNNPYLHVHVLGMILIKIRNIIISFKETGNLQSESISFRDNNKVIEIMLFVSFCFVKSRDSKCPSQHENNSFDFRMIFQVYAVL
jgi:hypothetical protein